MSSTPENPQVGENHLGFTAAMLAGGAELKTSELNGLPKYKSDIDAKEQGIEAAIKADKQLRVCNTIALALIATIAAVAGASCIAFSGGAANLHLFLPGVAYCVVSVGLMVWLVMVVSRSIRYQNNIQNELVDFRQSTISNSAALTEMLKEQATAVHIQTALSTFPPEMRLQFFNWVHGHIFKNEYAAGSLTDPQKKVLKTFANFPSEVAKMDIDSLHRDFIGAVREALPEGELKDQFTEKFGEPDPIEYPQVPIAGSGPQNFGAIIKLTDAAAESWNLEALLYTFPTLPESLKLKLLTRLADRCGQLIAQRETEEAVQATIDEALQKIEAIYNELFPQVLKDSAILSLFSSEGNAQRQTAWVELLARHPSRFASYLIENTESLPLLPTLINQVADKFTEDQKGVFNGVVSQIENHDVFLKNFIARYAKANFDQLPQFVVDLFKIRPVATQALDLEFLRNDASRPWLESEAYDTFEEQDSFDVQKKYIAQIFGQMSSDHQLRFLELSQEKGSDFRLTEELQRLAEHREAVENSGVLKYFTKYPNDFFEKILKNNKLTSENEDRIYELAIDLLVQMGPSTYKVVEALNKPSAIGGAPYLNRITNTAKKRVNTAGENVPERLALLAACLKYAPGADKNRQKMTFTQIPKFGKPSPWNIDSEGWEKFNQIASAHQSKVWKKAASIEENRRIEAEQILKDAPAHLELDKIVNAYPKAEECEQLRFLNELITRLESPEEQARYERIRNAIRECFKQSLEKAETIKNSAPWIEAFARVPALFVELTFNKQKSFSPDLINAVYEACDADKKAGFITSACRIENHSQLLLRFVREYQKRGYEALPHCFMDMYQDKVAAISVVYQHLGHTNRRYLEPFLEAMDQRTYLEFLEARSSDPSDDRVVKALQKIEQNPGRIPNSSIVMYFNGHFDEFEQSVLFNPKIGATEQERYSLAFELIKHMDAKISLGQLRLERMDSETVLKVYEQKDAMIQRTLLNEMIKRAGTLEDRRDLINVILECMRHTLKNSELNGEDWVNAFAQVPELFVRLLFEYQEAPLPSVAFINLVCRAIAADNDLQERFIQPVVPQEAYQPFLINMIKEYRKQNCAQLPEVIQAIYKIHPLIVHEADQKVGRKGHDFIASILDKMEPKTHLKFFEAERNSKQNHRLAGSLLMLQQNLEEISGSSVVKYFQKYPEEFQDKVINNKEINDSFALDLLENMGKQAEVAIETLDKGSWKGYPNFKRLSQELINEVQENNLELSKPRRRLIARFRFAPDAEQKIQTKTLKGPSVQLDEAWNQFTGVAKTQKKCLGAVDAENHDIETLQQMLEENGEGVIQYLLDPQNANLFVYEDIQEIRDLVSQLAHHPDIFANLLFESHQIEGQLLLTPEVVDAVYQEMADKGAFSRAVATLDGDQGAFLYYLTRAYTAQGISQIPDVCIDLYKAAPQLMSYIYNASKDDVRDQLIPIFNNMEPDHFITFLELDPWNEPDNRLDSRLSVLAHQWNGEEQKIEGSVQLAYFKKHPAEFNAHVILNEQLADDPKVRYTFALAMLKQLSEEVDVAQLNFESWDAEAVLEIYKKMDLETRFDLLDAIYQRFHQLDGNQKKLEVLLAKFSKTTFHDQQFQEAIIQDSNSELSQKWIGFYIKQPKNLASLLFNCDENSMPAAEFIDLFCEEISDQSQERFLEYNLRQVENAQYTVFLKALANQYQQSNSPTLPDCICEKYATLPEHVSAVDVNLKNGEDYYIQPILDRMNAQQTFAFFEASRNLGDERRFMATLLQLNPTQSCALYFKAHPEEFVQKVLENKEIEEESRYIFALDLLARMDDDSAKAVIEPLVHQGGRYPHFNRLLNLLIVESQDGEWAEERKALGSHFFHAPDAPAKMFNKSTWHYNNSELWNLQNSGPQWEAFRGKVHR